MAGSKIYAVKKGLSTGLYNSWEDCKAVVEGFPGAEYKSFKSRQEAMQYLGMVCEDAKQIPKQDVPKEGNLIAYVDGSYEHSLQKYAFGCVFLLPNGSVLTEKGSGNNPDSAKLRNVTGEMLGAMFAVKWAMKNGFQNIEICYDYEGIEKWVSGAWKSKTDLTMKYALAMRDWQNEIHMTFTKVEAHTNVYYNEMADNLAKSALVDTDGIPPVKVAAEMEAVE